MLYLNGKVKSWFPEEKFLSIGVKIYIVDEFLQSLEHCKW